MLNIGIPVCFGKVLNENDYKTRIEKIKEYGFSNYMTAVGFEHQNGTLKQQTEYAKKLGLTPSSLHSQYQKDQLHYFWEQGKIGDKMTRDLIHQLKLAKKYGFKCLVVHCYGEKNKIGLDRISKILKVANKLKTPLAIENIDCQPVFEYIFENIKDDMLKVCYDSGHEHCLSDTKILEKYLHKIVCLHLHDNYGKEICDRPNAGMDLHSFIGDGNINWNRIAKNLAKLPNISLDMELLLHYDNSYDYDYILKRAKNGLISLINKINKYKAENTIK